MAFKRGIGSVEVELARVQSWIEPTDEILYGADRDRGLIREHQEDRTVSQTREADGDKFLKRMVILMGAFGALGGMAGLIKVGELLHLIPR